METIGLLSITPNELRDLLRKVINESLDARLKNLLQESPAETDDQLLTRRETAKLLHVSLFTLRVWERRGVLRPRRISRRVLYMKAEVMEALKRISK